MKSGAKVLAARTKRKLTRQQMCKLADISRATGWRAEKGPGVSLETLEKIARAFSMKLDELR